MTRLTKLSLSTLLLLSSAMASAERITCKSHDYGYNRCGMETREGVRLVEQRSDAECRRGRSWGMDNDGVWVDEGCEGVFETRGDGQRQGNQQHRNDGVKNAQQQQQQQQQHREQDTYQSRRDECENTIAGNQCGR